MFISYSWSWSVESIQVLSLIGTYSLSLISITFFCIPFLFIEKKIIKKNIIFLLIFLIFFVGNYFYGIYKTSNSVKVIGIILSNLAKLYPFKIPKNPTKILSIKS